MAATAAAAAAADDADAVDEIADVSRSLSWNHLKGGRPEELLRLVREHAGTLQQLDVM